MAQTTRKIFTELNFVVGMGEYGGGDEFFFGMNVIFSGHLNLTAVFSFLSI